MSNVFMSNMPGTATPAGSECRGKSPDRNDSECTHHE